MDSKILIRSAEYSTAVLLKAHRHGRGTLNKSKKSGECCPCAGHTFSCGVTNIEIYFLFTRNTTIPATFSNINPVSYPGSSVEPVWYK